MVWRGGVAEGSGEGFEMRVLIELSMAWFSWLRHILIMGAHREPTTTRHVEIEIKGRIGRVLLQRHGHWIDTQGEGDSILDPLNPRSQVKLGATCEVGEQVVCMSCDGNPARPTRESRPCIQTGGVGECENNSSRGR